MMIFLPIFLMADFIKIDKDKILQEHNKLRAKHFDSPLKYSKTLEESSKKWALHLAKEEGCKMVHSHGEYGENLFWASAQISKSKRSDEKKWHISRSAQKIDDKKPVQDWYSEIKFYNYKTMECKSGEMCGHYTQVVWKDSKEVGCAAYKCDDKSQIWVCQYKPAGNIVGHRPY
jgi:pathogenesis-related protein 1